MLSLICLFTCDMQKAKCNTVTLCSFYKPSEYYNLPLCKTVLVVRCCCTILVSFVASLFSAKMQYQERLSVH